MSNLLAQGGFGCVYYPALARGSKQKQSKLNRLVTKVQRDDSSAKNEIRIGRKVKEYRDYRLFFLPVVESWKMTIAGKKLKEFTGCDAIDERTKKYIALDIPYVDAISYEQVLLQAPPRHRLLLLMEGYRYLLRAIEVLQALKISHFDLKHGNVLYLRSNKLPLIADFGISIYDPQSIISDSLSDTLSRLKRHFYVYTTQYRVWCLDIIVLSWIADTHKWGQREAEAIFDDFFRSAKKWEFVQPKKAKEWFRSTHGQLMLYATWDIEHLINYLMDQWTTWDSYALGVMYGETISGISGNQTSSFMEKWGDIVSASISPKPEDRVPVSQAVKAFEDLFLTEKDPRSYEQLVDDFALDTSMRADPLPIPGGHNHVSPKIEPNIPNTL